MSFDDLAAKALVGVAALELVPGVDFVSEFVAWLQEQLLQGMIPW